ncbi:hypothetical protein BQ8482_110354 [Mesorhizobium delmotii]|uniref:Uncharacterized protein n=1 Tax=Mesorhizobium delmotii TaxID=1631247 RepID=A0A2P9ABA2_9HYPH|nr:hypothetical protein BQ8482_110354 [Mesorhizobium delmotii]
MFQIPGLASQRSSWTSLRTVGRPTTLNVYKTGTRIIIIIILAAEWLAARRERYAVSGRSISGNVIRFQGR